MARQSGLWKFYSQYKDISVIINTLADKKFRTPHFFITKLQEITSNVSYALYNLIHDIHKKKCYLFIISTIQTIVVIVSRSLHFIVSKIQPIVFIVIFSLHFYIHARLRGFVLRILKIIFTHFQ